MAEVSELYDLDLLHVHYAIPHSVSALLARQMLAARPEERKLPFVTTLHGTDITLVGLDRSYLPITRFSIEAKRRSHRDFAISAGADAARVRHSQQHRGDLQLR